MEKNNFDFLRFFLAFVVIVGHTAELSGAVYLNVLRPYFNTSLAVKGFFIISGYLITISYITTKDIKKYFIKRAKRLLPAYLTVIIISAIGLSAVSTYSIIEYFRHLGLIKYLLANISFMNFVQPCLPGVFGENVICAVNGALWTLKVEVMFYFTVPLLIYFISRTSRKYLLFAGIYGLSVVYKYYFEYQYDVTHNSIYSTLNHQLPGFMSYFISGIALYYYRSFFTKYQLILAMLSVIAYFIEDYYKIELIKPFALACILFYLAYNFKFLNAFGSNGDFSYGIYIYHFPIIQLFFYFNIFQNYNPWIGLFAVLLLTVFAGFLSWHLLEKRFLKRRRT